MSPSTPKTLIFSFDGTGNEPSDAGKFEEDESISNVLKLHILLGGGIDKDRSDTKTPGDKSQITHYYNGIGTRESGWSIPLLGRLFSTVRKHVNIAMAPTFGDVRRILQEACDDFSEKKYQDGDTLVVLGFSRGAALARKFASKILDENENCCVSFMGVFDTVAAMNGVHRKGERISSDVFFENGTLNDRIQKVVHIVSLDEDRVPFTPTLINQDDKPDRIEEVWFPGVHSDIGGGYWHDGLSDNALAFVCDRLRACLGDAIKLADGTKTPAVQELFAEQKDGFSGLAMDDVMINPQVNSAVHRHSGLLAKVGDQEPRMVCVNREDRPSAQKEDLPILHWSVKERFDAVADYRPAALRGLKFRLLRRDNTPTEVVTGISGLRTCE